EDADELGLLAVEAERDTPRRAVPRRRGGHPTHQEVEVTQVVRVGHCIGAAARRVRREGQPLVEHVVLERSDSRFAYQPVDLPGRDPVGERGDATVADTDIAAEGTDVGHDDGAVEHGRVVARHGADYTIMTISRGSTALLLLDLQRDFLDPDGVYARHGLPVSRLRGIITTIARSRDTEPGRPRTDLRVQVHGVHLARRRAARSRPHRQGAPLSPDDGLPSGRPRPRADPRAGPGG